jgi:aspartyl-tRNA(Asn)/glutamyl-tRNA(Gln) amidotransferase subunit B
LKSLRLVLMYLGVNDGNMEEGSFRCDANVSVRKRGTDKLGTRVELKNINSFRFVRQAIDYEIERQVSEIEAGRRIVQETRLYDNEKGVTRAMRSKEEANDYRYFPEPDLPPLLVSQRWIDSVKVPRLPQEHLEALVAAGVSAADARTLVADARLVQLHGEIVAAAGRDSGRRAALTVIGEVARAVNEGEVDLSAPRFKPAQVAQVYALQDKGTLSSTAAKEVLSEVLRTGKDPAQVVSEKGLAQVSDSSALEAVVDAVIAKSPGEAEKYRAGKKALLGFLNELFKKRLGD